MAIDSKLSDKIRKKIEESKLGQTAKSAAQIATYTAKQGLDQVLLNLQHRGVNVKDPAELQGDIQDLIQRAGRSVLSRAEDIRAEIAKNPMSPTWLKNVSLTPNSPVTAADEVAEGMMKDQTALETEAGLDSALPPEASASMTEATVSEAAEQMQPTPMTEVLAQEKNAKARTSKAKGKSTTTSKT